MVTCRVAARFYGIGRQRRLDALYPALDHSREIALRVLLYDPFRDLIVKAEVGKVLKSFYEKGKLVGAICAAPTVLAANGVAEGATVTCHSCAVETMEPRYNYVGGDVVCDRNLITAVGAGLSIDFGLELLAALTNEATVEKVKKGMEISL